MSKMIPVSFKDSTEEMELYNYLKSKSSPSAFIKDLIKQHKSGQATNNTTPQNNKSSSGLSGIKNLIK